MKKKAKREEKRHYLARLTSPDPTIRLARAWSWPIVAALVPENLWEQGIGQLLIARRQPDTQLACGIFLLDTYCLGVKNAFHKIMPASEFQEIQRKCGRVGALQSVAPEYFAKLVYAAVDYAQSWGFAPHPDYRHARLLLSGIDPALCSDNFVFGKDGKPLYISGPKESLEKARSISQRIHAAGGDFIIPINEAEDNFQMLPESGRNMLARD